DEEVVLLFEPLATLQFFEDRLHILLDCIVDAVDVQLPEIREPARLGVLDPPVLREPFFVERIEDMPDGVQVDPRLRGEILVAVLPLGGELFEKLEPLVADQTEQVRPYGIITQNLSYRDHSSRASPTQADSRQYPRRQKATYQYWRSLVI